MPGGTPSMRELAVGAGDGEVRMVEHRDVGARPRMIGVVHDHEPGRREGQVRSGSPARRAPSSTAVRAAVSPAAMKRRCCRNASWPSTLSRAPDHGALHARIEAAVQALELEAPLDREAACRRARPSIHTTALPSPVVSLPLTELSAIARAAECAVAAGWLCGGSGCSGDLSRDRAAHRGRRRHGRHLVGGVGLGDDDRRRWLSSSTSPFAEPFLALRGGSCHPRHRRRRASDRGEGEQDG